MSFCSISECRTYQFSYRDQESLYRDHHGARVLADVEGAGIWSVLQSPKNTKIFVDGVLSERPRDRFLESLLITSEDPGPSRIFVQKGSLPTPLRPSFETEKFEGCGLILESEGLSSVDGITDGWEGVPQVYPIPILLRATGRKLRIRPLDGAFLKIAELSVRDEESLASHSWHVKNASKRFALESELPGVGTFGGEVLSHLNECSFEFEKPDGCSAILIRKLYDAFHGRQRARLIVNGQFRGWWYEPVEDRSRRWRWGHIGFAASREKAKVRISLDPPAGAPLWSVSNLEVLGLFESGAPTNS